MATSPFMQKVRMELRTHQYSLRTEKNYMYWIRLFIRFNDLKHPKIWVITKLNVSLIILPLIAK